MSTVHFTCPECEQRLTLEEARRAAVVATGCPLCTAPIGATAFEPPERVQ